MGKGCRGELSNTHHHSYFTYEAQPAGETIHKEGTGKQVWQGKKGAQDLRKDGELTDSPLIDFSPSSALPEK